MSKHYCYTCGDRTITLYLVYGYDEKTGKPLFSKQYNCPNKKWWQIWHDEEKEDIDYGY